MGLPSSRRRACGGLTLTERVSRTAWVLGENAVLSSAFGFGKWLAGTSGAFTDTSEDASLCQKKARATVNPAMVTAAASTGNLRQRAASVGTMVINAITRRNVGSVSQ